MEGRTTDRANAVGVVPGGTVPGAEVKWPSDESCYRWYGRRDSALVKYEIPAEITESSGKKIACEIRHCRSCSTNAGTVLTCSTGTSH